MPSDECKHPNWTPTFDEMWKCNYCNKEITEDQLDVLLWEESDGD